MRYYDFIITDQNNQIVKEWKSLNDDNTVNPGALQIEFDIPVVDFATPVENGAWLKIKGISLKEISQASNLTGKYATLYGGMSSGLPLANPSQQGQIVSGQIFQCYGNWQGVEQSIEFIFVSSDGNLANPRNISFDWAAGSPMAQAIQTTLQTAFPNTDIDIDINDQLMLTHDEPGYFNDLKTFAGYCNDVSKDIVKDAGYPGVRMTRRRDGIFVYDGSTPKNPYNVDFIDLIGQPTWLDAATIQVQVVLRGDLQVFDYIKLPATPILTGASVAIQSVGRNKLSFQGSFQIIQMRHVGCYKAPGAQNWITIINCQQTPNV